MVVRLGDCVRSSATGWLADLKLIAQDISDEQSQANTLLKAIHSFVSGIGLGEGLIGSIFRL